MPRYHANLSRIQRCRRRIHLEMDDLRLTLIPQESSDRYSLSLQLLKENGYVGDRFILRNIQPEDLMEIINAFALLMEAEERRSERTTRARASEE